MALGGALDKAFGLAPYPHDETRNIRVCEQGIDGRIIACQFFLGKERMNLPVAYAMQRHGVAAALRFRHQVVQVKLRGVDRSAA